MTNQTPTTTPAPTPATASNELPEGMKRTTGSTLDAIRAATRKMKDKAKAGVVAVTTSQPKAKAVEAKPEAKAKPAKAKPEAKAAPRKASNISRTEDNPAKSIVPVKFKKEYAAHNDTCGRPLNVALKEATTMKNSDGRDALDVKALWAIAKANGVDYKAYEGLNNGQKRMNVGNKLAGLVKAGTTVTIGSRKFANAEKALAKPSATA